jgi:hypothetical protein
VTITQTQLAGNVATYTWSSPSGAAPAVGNYVTVIGTTNYHHNFDVTHLPITSVTVTGSGTGTTSGTFTVALT